MDVDFVAMGMQLVNGSIDVAMGLATSGDYVTLGCALVAIVLGALFMASFEQLIQTTMVSLLIFVVLKIVYGASQAEWNFTDPIMSTWNNFTGTDEVAALTFFTFFCYMIVFAIAIGIVNAIKNMVAG